MTQKRTIVVETPREETHQAAMNIIAKERLIQEAKTARLKAVREQYAALSEQLLSKVK